MMDWRPIETALTDRRIIAWSKEYGARIVVWSDGLNFWVESSDTARRIPYTGAPTHWMPLPDSPRI